MEFHQIYQLVQDGNPPSTAQHLKEWLKCGPPGPFEAVSALAERPSSGSQEELRAAVQRLEALPAEVIQYLNGVQEGNQHFEAEAWSAAAQAYQSALDLHEPHFLMARESLEQQLQRCHLATEMQRQIAEANQAYLAKQWRTAAERFRGVKAIHREGLGVDLQELSEVIARCEQGQQYDLLVHQARNAVKVGAPADALKIYAKAWCLAHPDFDPVAEALGEEIEEVDAQQSLAAVAAEVPTDPFWTQWPVRQLGIIVFLIFISGVILLGLHWAITPLQRSSEESEKTVIAQTSVDSQVMPTAQTQPVPQVAASSQEAPASAGYFPPEAEPAPQPLVPSSTPAQPEEASSTETVSKKGESLSPVQAEARREEVKPAYVSEPAPSIEVVRIGGRSVAQADPAQVLASLPAPTEGPTPAPTPDPSPVAEEAAPTAPLAFAEQMPSFPGGEAAMASFFSQHIDYPAVARENEVEGTVYLQMVVQADGSLNKVEVVRGIGYGCDQEALRVVKKMPPWHPGHQGGQPVPVTYTIPIVFRIR